MQVYRFKEGQSFVSSTGLEAPGFALSGAIGVGAAMKKAPVICLTEDRGFQACSQSLQAIIDYNLDIRIVVLRSKGSAGIRHIQKDFFGGRFVGTDGETRLNSPPISAIGALYGLPASTIQSPSEIHGQLRDFLNTPGPSLCEVLVDSEQELLPRMAFNIKPDGKWLAKPLEDMYPFLSREEIKQTMKIPVLQED
jgi:acetolactate synthase-1/2/3 large subunit